ncbi:uncharacterized protein FFB20_04855 [Fusarium fujikuroi]|uniref:Uncharacterized protein n=1 Tax=Fusarium fujikuroi TaxID=5127 RepID=A0A2H3S119_FUSFU|nr:Uncharacterized protein Y057_10607 [Fusarium fujikuroi]QGI61961.1 hypothetical protein CEK27_005932 [Fusarium fujikuroi]SCN75434.1 uncharacterized protein FFB20_04855 [Fusarium fujikuroi]SCN76640.1 uncharacterized protein FFE2_03579 [Fusarium fujikuroi]SCN94864.1 uncharacterized protein FFC1_07159 [Fusarium fujikuroi]
MASQFKSIGQKEYDRVLGELSASCKNIQTATDTETRSELVAEAMKAADQLGISTIHSPAAINALSVIGVKAHKALEELVTARKNGGDDIAVVARLLKDLDNQKSG